MSNPPTFQGLITLGSDRKIKFSCGLGDEAALQSLVLDKDWHANMKTQRMSALTLNGKKLILLWSAVEGGEVLLISTPNAEDAFDFIAAVDFSYDIINHLVSNPFDAMTIVDAEEKIAFISPVHEDFFGQTRGESIGKPVTDVIENTHLHQVLKSGKAEVGAVQQMKEGTRIVSRTPIFRDKKVIGAMGRVMFKGPEQLEELNKRVNTLEREVEFYKREAEFFKRQDYGLDTIIGESEPMRRLKDDITRLAHLDVPVLITGESGVGKELVAQALHKLSLRRNHQMVMVNTAALPAGLVESELFGYASGAFTGANQKGHAGKFEQAHKGTLFLDEIGDMPLEVQAKLLRVLQDGLIERVGGAKSKQVDFRLITATNHDLEQQITNGEFRLDLYYRISPVILQVPPLGERLDDIPLLAARFLEDFATRHRMDSFVVTPNFIEQLQSCPWPGNVRQLKHEVERACIFATDGNIDHLRQSSAAPNRLPDTAGGLGASFAGAISNRPKVNEPLKNTLEKVENDVIQDALTRLGGNKKRVAEELGISRSFLYKKLAEIGAD